MTTLRASRKVARLTSSLSTLSSGPSSQALPSSIASLELRYAGLKGNAGARHFSKEHLASIRFANPSVPITIASKPSAEHTEAWQQPPGVILTFKDSPRTAFLPFPAERSDKLAKTFWETLGSPEALSALPEAPAPTSAPSPAVKESEKGQAVKEEIKEARENVSPEQVKQEADRALPGKATPSES